MRFIVLPLIGVIITGALVISCDSGRPGCDPNMTQECICADGFWGEQTCSSDGTYWNTCDCENSGTDGDGDSDGDGDGDGDADADTEGECTERCVVGPSGGTVRSADERLTLEIPAGALTEEIEFTIDVAVDSPPDAVGPAYDIEPSGTRFDRLAALRFSLGEEEMTMEDPTALRVVWFDGSEWVPLSLGGFDFFATVAYAMTEHLTPFSLINGQYVCRTSETCNCERDIWEDCCLSTIARSSPGPCGCQCFAAADTVGSVWRCDDPVQQRLLERAQESYWEHWDCYIAATAITDDSFYCSAEWRQCCREAHGYGPHRQPPNRCICNFPCTGDYWGYRDCIHLAEQAGTLYNEPPECGCGNGVRESGSGAIVYWETCDGEDLGGATCVDQGFAGGELRCNENCEFEASHCWQCGNGILDPGEECDGYDLGGQTCEDLGFDGGDLACTFSRMPGRAEAVGCTYDTSGCFLDMCGDGHCVEPETCDTCPEDCANRNYVSAGICPYDCGVWGPSDCAVWDFTFLECAPSGLARCCSVGNERIDYGEECDGSNLGGETCESLGLGEGRLACDERGRFDRSGCRCGNGTRDVDEDCEGDNLGGATCESLGYLGGALGCTSTCDYDIERCAHCGNGIREEGEECDGRDFDDTPCDPPWALECTIRCTLDMSACSDCGNGVIDAGEECDGGRLNDQTCESLWYGPGVLRCSPGCQFDASDCNLCGNGFRDVGEECDGDTFGHSCHAFCEIGEFLPPACTQPRGEGVPMCDELCQLNSSNCRLIPVCP